jgi:predicted MPP superfamily phosphohydrolase
MQKILRLTLLLVTGSEVLILHWLMLALRGRGLTPLQWILWLVLLGGFNLVALPMARRRLRATGLGLAFSRAWILGSVGALMSGGLLGGVWVIVGGALLLARGLSGADFPAGDSFLVAFGGVALVLGFGSILWGSLVGQRRLRVERVELPLPGVPPQISALRIAQVSDLHIGPLLPPSQLRCFVEQINRLEPDLIVITGDIFDFDPRYVEEGCRELAKLSAGYGVFGILGNHDVYTGVDEVVHGIQRLTSLQLLRNEWARIEVGGAALCLAGIEDSGSGWTERDSESPELERLAHELPKGLPRLLLFHRPSLFRQAARLGFPVSLAGHTHGGQISLPLARNYNASRVIAHWTRGLFRIGESLLYVNRGLGVAGLPVRLNCPREIALIRLVERQG